MNIKQMDLEVSTNKAIELLQDRKSIKEKLDKNGYTECRINTENYKITIRIDETVKTV